jgi:two-component system cell cycle sensor histidine kinase/response regulator CckA
MNRVQRFLRTVTDIQAIDRDEVRKEFMARVILLMTALVVVLFTVPILIGWIAGAFELVDVMIMLVLASAVGASHWLTKRGRWRLAILGPIITLFLLGLLGNHFNGLSTTLNLSYVLVILLTAIFYGARAQFAALVLCTFCPIAIDLLRMPNVGEDILFGAIPFCGLLTGIALLQWFSTKQLQGALRQAHNYAAELQAVRDNLEDLVKARYNELQAANQELQREIAERLLAEEALQRAHDRLEQRVEARTAELTAANATLQAEIAVREQAEKDLRESEARYRQLVEHAPAGIYEIDMTNLRFTEVNDVMCEYTGYTREEFLELNPLELMTEESQKLQIERQQKIIAGEPVADTVEYKIKGKNDREFWVILNARYTREKGAPTRAAVVVHNITERKKAEEALRESEATLRAFINAIPEPAFLLDADANILVANESSAERLGHSPDTLVGEYVYDLLPADLAALGKAQVDRVIQTGQAFHFEDARGDRHYINYIYPVLDATQSVSRVAIFALDISDRKRAEEALARERDLLHALMDNIPDNIYFKDPQSRFTRINHAQAQVLGVANPADAIGKTDFDYFAPEHARDAYQDEQEIVHTGQSLVGKRERIRRADGSFYWVSVTKVPIMDPEGRVIGLVGISRDIDERVKAEEALRRSEALLHSVLESLPQNVYSKDLDGRFTYANQRYCATEGKLLEDILGRTDFDLHPPESARKYRDDDRRVIETGEVFETVEEHKPLDQESSYVQVIKTPLYDTEGQVTGTLGIFWDITERKRAEVLLQALNRAALAMENALTHDEIFEAISEEFGKLGMTCMLLPTDGEKSRLFTTHIDLNSELIRKAEKLTGYQQKSYSFPIEDVDLYRRVVWERKTEFIQDTETVMRQVLPSPAKGFARLLIKMMDYWTAIATPLIVADEVIGVLSVQSTDLTEADVPAITAFANQVAAAWRKARLMQNLEKSLEELRRTQSQLIQAQKMEAVGRLAGGIAHDFNNLLTVTQVSAQLVMAQLHPQDPLWEHVQQIQKAGERAATLTKQLLSFSRREMIEPRVISLNTVVGELDRMLQRVIGEDIELSTDLAESLWPVKADPSQLEQMIINLVVNARDAMPHGGRLSIATANLVLDRTSAARHLGANPGEYVTLTISDTGIGMDEEVKNRVFEPFFTTKEREQGTGLGLSTVYGIVKQNEGHIWLDSQVGQGTVFHIYLPRTAESPPPRPKTLRRAPPTSVEGTETILVVEDEIIVRELAVQILKSHGYRVLEASHGLEALQVSQEWDGPLHLLLTDVVMPEMNGKDLAERLQAQRPDVRVVFMSGYGENVIADHGILNEGITFLPKPFSLEILTQKIRAVLDEPA